MSHTYLHDHGSYIKYAQPGACRSVEEASNEHVDISRAGNEDCREKPWHHQLPVVIRDGINQKSRKHSQDESNERIGNTTESLNSVVLS